MGELKGRRCLTYRGDNTTHSAEIVPLDAPQGGVPELLLTIVEHGTRMLRLMQVLRFGGGCVRISEDNANDEK